MSEKKEGAAEAPKKSWFSTGYDKAKEVAERMENRTDYLSIEDGKSATIRFLHDKPLCLFEHRVKSGERFRMLTCLDGTGDVCPLCEAGIPKSFKGYFSVFDQKDGKVKQYKAGVKVLKSLDKFFAKYGTLKDRTYEISRSGSGLATTYTFAPDDKSPMTDAEKNAKLIEFEKTLEPKARAKVLEIMAVKPEEDEAETGEEAPEAASDKVKF